MNDSKVLGELATLLKEAEPDSKVLLDPTDSDAIFQYKPGKGEHLLLSGYKGNNDVPMDRYIDLYLASLGARLRSDQVIESSVYSGGVPKDGNQLRVLLTEGKYAEARAKAFHEYNVKYIGSTFSDPRFILVVDNKKDKPPHNPALHTDIEIFLESAPEEWWLDLAIVSSGNIDSLGEFLDFIEYTIPISYSEAGCAKLRVLKLAHARIDKPEDDDRYGVKVREICRRLSYELSLK